MPMKTRHKRFALLGGLLVAVSAVVALVLNAFQSNLVFFFSPTQVAAHEAPRDRNFRIGGLVEEGSLKREGQSLTMNFVITDMAQRVTHRNEINVIVRQWDSLGVGLYRLDIKLLA